MHALYLGIDIGGTKMAVGLATPTGELVAEGRVPTPVHDPERAVSDLVELCTNVIRGRRVTAVGVGCAGPLDPARGIIQSPPNLPGWVDTPLVARLTQALKVPVYLDNDANAAALGEHRFGAGRGAANMVYITISTGIGSGIIFDGRLCSGENSNAGEIGHASVAYDGIPCKCGSRGCLEAYASGTAITAAARAAVMESGGSSALLDLAGSVDRITGETVVTAVRQGDPLAVRIWAERMTILGVGIANVINSFNPERIVLGGGLTNAGDLLFNPVRRVALTRALPPLAQVVEIVPGQLGGRVGVLGAVAVALERIG